jgi:hypothetical protein
MSTRLLDAIDLAPIPNYVPRKKGILLLVLYADSARQPQDSLDVLSAGQSIERRRLRDNTDDVGLVSKRWVLTPPKGLGTILN